MGAADLKDVLVDLERQGWDSLCRGEGADFYGRMLTADGVMVLADGSVLDRAAVVASLRQAPPWRTYDIDEARVIPAGPDTAVLVYVGTGYRDGEDPAFVGVMSSLYRSDGDQWRLIVYQQTPLPGAR